MAKLLKCPKCPMYIDATGLKPGAVASCPNCQTNVRVPSGKTGVYDPQGQRTTIKETPPLKKVQEAKLFEKVEKANIWSTIKAYPSHLLNPIRRKGPVTIRKKSNTALFLLSFFLFLVVGIILIIVLASKKPQSPAPSTPPPKKPATPKTTESPFEGTSDKEKEQPSKKFKEIKIRESVYKVPVEFEKGIRTKTNVKLEISQTLATEFDRLCSVNAFESVLERSSEFLPAAINRLCTDDENKCKKAAQVLEMICKKENIKLGDKDVELPPDLMNDLGLRVKMYEFFVNFYLKQYKTAPENGVSKDPRDADWKNLVGAFRTIPDKTDKGYEYVKGTSASQVIEQIEAYGPSAYPYLWWFLDSEDPVVARGVAYALRYLTKKEGPVPEHDDKQQVKDQWKQILNLTDEQIEEASRLLEK